MLTRALKTVAAALLMLFVLIAAPGQAWAKCWEEQQLTCPPNGGDCIIEVIEVCDGEGDDGSDGGSGGGGGGGESECTWQGQTVDCYKEGLGWYNMAGCYYLALDPQPPAGDGRWGDGDPETDTVYQRRCITDWGGYDANFEVLTDPPPGYGGAGGVTAEELAQQAIENLPITGPIIGITPEPDGQGLVGMPVWLWTEQTAETWGPISETASAGSLSVTATATAARIDWDMGNGHVETCENPGVPYEAKYEFDTSPSCGYDYYPQPGVYTVTATTTWAITWASADGNASGSLEVTRDASVQITIDEGQALR